MKIKKFLSIVLACAFVMVCAVPAFAFEEENVQSWIVNQSRFTGIISFDASVQNVGTTIEGSAYASIRSGYTGVVKLYIQRSSNGTTWSNYYTSQSFSLGDGAKDYFEIIKKSVSMGYYYRTKATISVYSSGALVESTTAFSNAIYI